MRKAEQKLEHGFFVRDAGDWGSAAGKEKRTGETTDPFVNSKL
jgi:hypothetical protein